MARFRYRVNPIVMAPTTVLCLTLTFGTGSLVTGCQRGSATTLSAHPAPSGTPASSVPPPSPHSSYSAPPEARLQTEAGAVAFLRYYIDTVNKAWTTPDSTLLPVLADPGCKSCSGLQEVAQELRDKNQRYEISPLVIEQITISPGAPDGQQFLNLRIREVGARVLDSKRSVVRTETPNTVERKAGVIWKEDRWLLYGLA